MDKKVKCTDVFGGKYEKSLDDMFEGDACLKSVTIPEGVKFVNAGQFSYCEQLKEVKLPNSLIEISENAFKNCSELENIEIPDNVDRIGYYAFNQCDSLKTIKLPQKLKAIEKATFADCTNLKEIVIPENVKVLAYYSFAFCKKLEKIEFPKGLEIIHANAFSDCISLKEVELPENLEKLPDECFISCSSLEKVKLNGKCFRIGRGAFDGCAKLQKIEFNDKLEEVLGRAFTNCTLLNEITFPDGVTYIGNEAFKDCATLKKVHLPKELKKISPYTFEKCVMLKNIELPSNITEIGKGAFLSSGIKEISIPYDIEHIEDMTFYECGFLEKIDLPDTITTIGEGAFFSCTSLKNIDLPKNLKCIGDGAFSCCGNLRSVSLPNGIEEIGDRAFSGCNQLSDIRIPKTIKKIGSSAFSNCNLNRIEIPKNCETDEFSFFNSGLKYVYLNRNGEMILTKEKDEKLEKSYFVREIEGDGYLFFHENYRKNLLMLTALKDSGKIKFIPPDYTLELFPNSEIENYYIHNNNLRYGRLVKELKFNDLDEELKVISLCELMKVYYILGGFSENQGESEKAYDYLLKYVAERYSEDYDENDCAEALHYTFSNLNIDNGYNKNFAKFFMKYYKDNPDFMKFNLRDASGRLRGETNYLCSAYNCFNNIEKLYPNMTINGTSRVSVLTPKFVAEHCTIKAYENVLNGNEELALIAGKYGYEQESFELMQKTFESAKKIKDECVICASSDESNPISFKVLKKDDILGFVLGDITNCCQRIGSAGETCVIDAYTNKNSGLIVFEKPIFDENGNKIEEKSILGQAYVWYDGETKTVCLDNIEIPLKVINDLSHSNSGVKDFMKAVSDCAKSLANTMNKNGIKVEKVTTGKGFNDLNKYLVTSFNLDNNPTAKAPIGVYSDAKYAQYVLIDKSKETARVLSGNDSQCK